MAFGYRYTLERQKNGWWVVRFLSPMWIIDEALAKMGAELPIDLPKSRTRGKAA